MLIEAAIIPPALALTAFLLVSASNAHGIGWIYSISDPFNSRSRRDMTLAVFYDVILFMVV